MTSGVSPEILLHGLSIFAGSLKGHVADPAVSFRVRIAEHLLLSLAFEIQAGEGHDRAAISRLAPLVGEPPLLPPTAAEARARRRDLEGRLSSTLRSDEPLDEAGMLAAIRANLRDELGVTNPRFDLGLRLL